MKQKQLRVAIMSSAGGTGKSTVAVNTAYQLARMGKATALVDCDPNGSLALFTGLEDPPTEKNLSSCPVSIKLQRRLALVFYLGG